MNILRLLKSEHGDGMIVSLYTMLILMMILFIGIDIVGYTSASWKLRNACSQTLTIMKMENGFDDDIEERFFQCIKNYGLDFDKTNVSGTPKYVQRGDRITIKASIPYVLKSLRPFNKEFNFIINVEISSFAQEFIR